MLFKDLKIGMILENTLVDKSSPNRYHKIIDIKKNDDGGKPYTDIWGGYVGVTPKYALVLQNMNKKEELTHYSFYSLDEDFEDFAYRVVQSNI